MPCILEFARGATCAATHVRGIVLRNAHGTHCTPGGHAALILPKGGGVDMFVSTPSQTLLRHHRYRKHL